MAAQEVSGRAGTGTRSTLATGSSCSVWQTSKRPSWLWSRAAWGGCDCVWRDVYLSPLGGCVLLINRTLRAWVCLIIAHTHDATA